LLGEAFCGLRAFAGLGELLVPLRLWGSWAVEPDFRASGLRVSSALGISSTVSGAFTKEPGSISWGVLYNVWSQKKQPSIKGRFKSSLPIGSAHGEPSPGAFRRSWSRRWVGSQIIDLDS
jgi:hypothetical protein